MTSVCKLAKVGIVLGSAIWLVSGYAVSSVSEVVSASTTVAGGPSGVATETLQDSGVTTPSKDTSPVPFRWQAGDHYTLRWNSEQRLVNSVYSVQYGSDEPILITSLPSLNTEESRTLRDWVQEVRPLHPQRLRRNIARAQLAGKLTFDDEGVQPLEVRMDSPLVARETSVQFTYIPKTGEYGRYYDRNSGLEERLRHLRLDLEYDVWRPQGKVGQEWTLPVEAMVPVLSPGGKMSYVGGTPKEAILVRSLQLGLGGSWEPILRGAGKPNSALKGEVQAKWEQVADSPLGPEAHITFRFQLENKIDRTDTARATRRRVERFEGMKIMSTMIGVRANGTGRMIWDVNRGRVKGINLDGQTTLTMDMTWQKGAEPVTVEHTEYRGNFEVDGFLLHDPNGDEAPSWEGKPTLEQIAAAKAAIEEAARKEAAKKEAAKVKKSE